MICNTDHNYPVCALLMPVYQSLMSRSYKPPNRVDKRYIYESYRCDNVIKTPIAGQLSRGYRSWIATKPSEYGIEYCNISYRQWWHCCL